MGWTRNSLVLAALLGASFVGCNRGPAEKTVTGTLTYQGKPVTRGMISFQAGKSRPVGGGIQSDGTYSLKVPSGEYQVRIDAPAPLPEGFKEGMPMPKLGPPLVPEKYANFASSGLAATIDDQGGAQTVDFKLP